MKEFISSFTKRGLIAAGFGPFILTIFYYAYYLAIHYNPTSVLEINKNILSSLILAFIAGGISAIFKVEKLSLGIATLINAVVIYIDYLFFYLFNDWVEMSFTPLIVFTICYIVGYVIIWLCIYHQVKAQIQKVNQKL